MASNQTSSIEQKKAAQVFVKYWQESPCIEETHSHSFWMELLDIVGVPNLTRALDFEYKINGRRIDIFYEDMGILIEMKSRGVSLDDASQRSKQAGYETPYQQAKWYADNLAYSIRPRWIITCNFDEFRIYDLEHPEAKYTEVLLSNLPDQLYLFDFFIDQSQSRLVKEQELSIEAGKIVGKLYQSFARQYQNIDTDKHEQRSLNILIVRLVFLLYAEHAGLLQSHLGFCKYMETIQTHRMRQALIDLFKVLNTPENERDPYLDEDLPLSLISMVVYLKMRTSLSRSLPINYAMICFSRPHANLTGKISVLPSLAQSLNQRLIQRPGAAVVCTTPRLKISITS